jgi:hypothetical protein
MNELRISETFVHTNSMNVFFSKEYATFVRLQGEKYLYVSDKNYVMPIMIRRVICFCYATLLSEPFCYNDEDARDESRFLEDSIHTLKNEKHIQWVISSASCFFKNTPQNCERIPFGSHVIDLSKEEDVIFANMNGKHRNVIKKAMKDGVEIRFGHEELLNDYVIADIATWKRANTKVIDKYNYYYKRVKTLADKMIIVNAYLNNTIQAGAIFYFNKNMSYYMYGASIDSPTTGAANYLHWEAIKYMKRLGVKEYSFVGCRINEDENSKYHGIQRFKERFGGELRQGFLFHSIMNTFAYQFFCKIMQLRLGTKEPYKDAIDQEIHKWPDIQPGNRQVD